MDFPARSNDVSRVTISCTRGSLGLKPLKAKRLLKESVKMRCKSSSEISIKHRACPETCPDHSNPKYFDRDLERVTDHLSRQNKQDFKEILAEYKVFTGVGSPLTSLMTLLHFDLQHNSTLLCCHRFQLPSICPQPRNDGSYGNIRPRHPFTLPSIDGALVAASWYSDDALLDHRRRVLAKATKLGLQVKK